MTVIEAGWYVYSPEGSFERCSLGYDVLIRVEMDSDDRPYIAGHRFCADTDGMKPSTKWDDVQIMEGKWETDRQTYDELMLWNVTEFSVNDLQDLMALGRIKRLVQVPVFTPGQILVIIPEDAQRASLFDQNKLGVTSCTTRDGVSYLTADPEIFFANFAKER